METVLTRKLTALCVICGLASLALLGLAAVRDEKREWKDYQQEYQAQLLGKIDRADNPVFYQRVANMQPEIKQVMLDGPGEVDRCTTCHMGIEDALFADAKLPLTAHPNPELLVSHPVEKFGCTVCHGGKGAGTTYAGAVHQNSAHWPDPMVEKGFMQSRCGYCHTNHEEIGADKLVLGQKLFKDMHCSGCHKVAPGDGVMAPVLTDFADKGTGHFDFTYINGDHSRQNWVMEHFKDLQRVTPSSPMRIYAMNDDQIAALTTYVLSLTERNFTRQYYPKDKAVVVE